MAKLNSKKKWENFSFRKKKVWQDRLSPTFYKQLLRQQIYADLSGIENKSCPELLVVCTGKVILLVKLIVPNSVCQRISDLRQWVDEIDPRLN